jgi:hypothetical protein
LRTTLLIAAPKPASGSGSGVTNQYVAAAIPSVQPRRAVAIATSYNGNVHRTSLGTTNATDPMRPVASSATRRIHD